MSKQDEYRHWPFLTPGEFELACAFLDRRYVRAKLGPMRQVFKLHLRRTTTIGTSYIEIFRLLKLPEDDTDLSIQLSRLWNSSERLTKDQEMEVDVNEETDYEALRPHPTGTTSPTPSSRIGGGHNELPHYSLYSHQPYAVYEIHLHSTYSMPTLWFTLHDLPMGEKTFDLESVYRYLVPLEYKDRLRAAGVIGGISAAPHPITGLPAFFIHPCQTKEALENFDCSMKDYLVVWLGLVGGCVGLWIPQEMAQDDE